MWENGFGAASSAHDVTTHGDFWVHAEREHHGCDRQRHPQAVSTSCARSGRAGPAVPRSRRSPHGPAGRRGSGRRRRPSCGSAPGTHAHHRASWPERTPAALPVRRPPGQLGVAEVSGRGVGRPGGCWCRVGRGRRRSESSGWWRSRRMVGVVGGVGRSRRRRAGRSRGGRASGWSSASCGSVGA